MENEEDILKQDKDDQGSQIFNPVSPSSFSSGIKNINSIKNKIEEIRNKNLNDTNYINDTSFNNGGTVPPLDNKSNLNKGNSSMNNNPVSNGGNISNKNNSSLPNKIESNSLSKKNALKKADALGSKKGLDLNKGLNKAANMSKDLATKFTMFVKNAISFFSTPFGWVVLFIGGIFLLLILFPVIFAMIINSFGMKFGLTGDETLEVFYEEYSEKMSREEIDNLMKTAEENDPLLCEEGLFDRFKHFFGFYDLEDNCEFAHYVKKIIEDREKETEINTISPGFILSSLYYAFDTQNTDENGDLFIRPEDNIDNDGTPEEVDYVNDLDAITTLMGVKIYDKDTLDTLLDHYLFYDDYTYYSEVWIYPDEEKGETFEPYRICESNHVEGWKIDENRLKIFLRYGENVSEAYVIDTNRHSAYSRTDDFCLDRLSFDDPDVTKYTKTANPYSSEDDGASVSILDDYLPENIIGTYGYDSGFIYTTYPRYNPLYIIGHQKFYDFMTDKDIEGIIENIASRQDYINYILGYPNSVPVTAIADDSYPGGTGAVCSFELDGVTVSDIKVRLLHAKNNAAIPGVGSYAPIQGQELISFDQYILGVTYAENGSAPTEALKTQAIVTASYVLSHANKGNNIKLIKENGQNILEVSSSTFNQVYCDPDKGCYICISPSNSTIQTVLTAGTVPEGASCKFWKGPLPSNSNVRDAVKEVAGMILLDSNGKIGSGSYTTDTHNTWNAMAKEGKSYIEILRKTYGSGYQVSSSTCSYMSSGEWSSWRQFNEPWASKIISYKTMKEVGCLITANAMMLANSGKPLTVKNFNPGTFLDLLKRTPGTLSGNSLYNEKAIEAALGNHNFSYYSVIPNGNYEDKVKFISDKLNQGYHVILGVKSNGHWVYVTGVNGDKIYMADPASGKKIVTDIYNKNGIMTVKYIKFN